MKQNCGKFEAARDENEEYFHGKLLTFQKAFAKEEFPCSSHEKLQPIVDFSLVAPQSYHENREI